ncbi:CBASS oligonucleotide cyclase [Haloferula chungangensis]|uniref:CBASS oligonucleotide cyclase n=1 Tax=Haloferula chungangensis TaxID=1048331 RepID=A0ABW2LDA8_9BACT
MSTLFDFSTPEVTHDHVQDFADAKVNLPTDTAKVYRAQVRTLRDRLETYLGESPDFGLKKMLLSGSLAKRTALKTLNDIDVAVYVASDQAPHKLGELLTWLADRLRKTYHQIAPENIYIDEPCVVISFKGTGLDVEITPILYDGDPDWRGYLWTRYGQDRVLTSIPMHLDFIKRRKDANPGTFAQVVRILKWWAKQRRADTSGFELKSFMIELIMAKVADGGANLDDHYAGLESFFLYIQRTALRERIAFADNYALSGLPARGPSPVEILDPVTSDNNVAATLTDGNRQTIVNSAIEALDILSWAKSCQTKQDAVTAWKDLMGPTFNA